MKLTIEELRDAIRALEPVHHLSWSTNKATHISEPGQGPKLVPYRAYLFRSDISQQTLDFVIGTSFDEKSAFIVVRDQPSALIAGMLSESLGIEETPKEPTPQIETPQHQLLVPPEEA